LQGEFGYPILLGSLDPAVGLGASTGKFYSEIADIVGRQSITL
jgi:hypothetical protein